MGLLNGKVALVTGAAAGIGRAIAQACAAEGARVVVADLNDEAGAETVASIEAAAGQASFIHCDVTDESQVKAMVQHALTTYGALDVACNSAAVTRGGGPIHRYEREDWDQTLALSLTNTWLCMKHELEPMLAAGKGAIVNISSNASLKGQPNNTAYAAAKGGVNVLTHSSAGEYARKGIRINAVSPGTILTPGVATYFEQQPQQREQLSRRIPMDRLGEPEEIAQAVVFLLSDRASYITGQVLSVDGGAAVF